MKALRLAREAGAYFEQHRPHLAHRGGPEGSGTEWCVDKERHTRFFLPASPVATLCGGEPWFAQSWQLEARGGATSIAATTLARPLEVRFCLTRLGDQQFHLAMRVGPRVCVVEFPLQRCEVIPLLDDFGAAFPSAAAAWRRGARALLAAA